METGAQMEQLSIPLDLPRRIYTVAELTGAIKGLLEGEFSDVWVAGEISSVTRAGSGHYYFTLKDAEAQIRCVCWKSYARLLKFKPEDGVAVLARGRIDVYPPRGQYQLVVEVLEPQGLGALQLAFEQLKKKLEAEGLFAAERKRPLPRFPQRVGIVTSPSGAAIRDLIHVLTRRWPGLHIRLYPAQVQGEGSAAAVIEGIEYFGRSGWPDVVIVGRGGGSLEDLWTFNEEAVARAIAACPVPVVSAVGHETDFTIADFVADLRAPTPSAAAELVAPEQSEVLRTVESLRRKLEHALRYRLSRAWNRLHERGVERAAGLLRRRIALDQQRVDEFEFRLRDAVRRRLEAARRRWEEADRALRRKDLRLRLAELRRRLQAHRAALAAAMRSRLSRARARLDPLAAALEQISPLRVLERGYAIVQDPAGKVIRRAEEAPVGSALRVRLHRGRLGVTVRESQPES